MNIKGSGASLIGLSGLKGSGASLQNLQPLRRITNEAVAERNLRHKKSLDLSDSPHSDNLMEQSKGMKKKSS